MPDQLQLKTHNLINGQATGAAGGGTLDVIEPATGEVLAAVPACDADDVRSAVDAAAGAFESWKRATPKDRAERLLALADKIESESEHLARVESRNVGKPLPVARDEVPLVVDNIRFFAGAARCLEGRASGEYLAGYESTIRREPIGVVAGIAPWNYPLLMAAWKFAPALAAGNCSILKPSRLTPLTALHVADLARDIFPAGVFNVLSGSASEMGDALVGDRQVAMVSVTGDTETGKKIARIAAGHVARTHLELGGKAPVLVFDDADIAAAAAAIALGGYVNSGQDCTAACRVIATPAAFDKLLDELVPAVESLRVGDPARTEDLDMGPVISAARRAEILSVLDRTNGKIITGGRSFGDRGFFVEPTVVVNPTQDDIIVQTELFGPVVSVQRAADEAQALTWANDVSFGLASSVWTQDLSRAHRMVRELDFGCVWINDHLPVISEMPHGGFKQSGYGKDMSIYGLEDYTRVKHVMTRYA